VYLILAMPKGKLTFKRRVVYESLAIYNYSKRVFTAFNSSDELSSLYAHLAVSLNLIGLPGSGSVLAEISPFRCKPQDVRNKFLRVFLSPDSGRVLYKGGQICF